MDESYSEDLGDVLFREHVDVRFSHFLICEPDSRRYAAQRPSTGLVQRRPDGLVCVTGALTDSADVSVVAADSAPRSALDLFEDVVELSYTSAHGELKVLTWNHELVGKLVTLPGGAGNYRLRYHLRGADQADDVAVLVQLWPADASPRSTLKATSNAGVFWTSATARASTT